MERKTFDDVLNNQEHEQEIRSSRVGGFGGSDADLFLRVGRKGIAALTATDKKRIAVMLGESEPASFAGNEYTRAGHAFEDYVANRVLANSDIRREVVLERDITPVFRTFAHADFTNIEATTVIECKYTHDDLTTTARHYAAQLQWYYILGAKSVTLLHGTGDVEPFNCTAFECVEIAQDHVIQEELLRGVAAIAEYVKDLATSDKNTAADDVTSDALDSTTAELVAKYVEAKRFADNAKKQADALNVQVLEAMQKNNIASIKGADYTIVFSDGATRRTFNIEKFLTEHSEYNNNEYFTLSKGKPSVTLRFKKKKL